MFLTIKNKRKKIILNTFLVFIVGCVALGRIMSGAHYLSDVYIGGTITFL
jgi:membrane-associated phospholipid phosphatase